jgi:hypothetical protein
MTVHPRQGFAKEAVQCTGRSTGSASRPTSRKNREELKLKLHNRSQETKLRERGKKHHFLIGEGILTFLDKKKDP